MSRRGHADLSQVVCLSVFQRCTQTVAAAAAAADEANVALHTAAAAAADTAAVIGQYTDQSVAGPGDASHTRTDVNDAS